MKHKTIKASLVVAIALCAALPAVDGVSVMGSTGDACSLTGHGLGRRGACLNQGEMLERDLGGVLTWTRFIEFIQMRFGSTTQVQWHG